MHILVLLKYNLVQTMLCIEEETCKLCRASQQENKMCYCVVSALHYVSSVILCVVVEEGEDV